MKITAENVNQLTEEARLKLLDRIIVSSDIYDKETEHC